MAATGQAIKRLSAGGNQYDLILDVSMTSQSIPNNTTTLSYRLWIRKNSGSGYSASDTKHWNLNIGGQTRSGTIAGYSFVGKTFIDLATGSVTITHDANGSKSITISATFTDSGYTGIGSGTATNTMVLDTIPRASSIGTITGNQLGSAITVAISRASSSFTHTMWYSFGSLTWQGGTGSLTTSWTFTPPLTLANQIPNATSGTMTLILRTFNGTTQVGSDVSKTFTINLPTSVVPTIGSMTHQEMGGAALGAYIQGKNSTNIKILGAAGVYGSTIKSYKIVGNNATADTSDAQFATFVNSGDITFTGTVTDSRGRVATRTLTVNVISNVPSALQTEITSLNIGSTYALTTSLPDSRLHTEVSYQSPNGTWVNLGKNQNKSSWSLEIPTAHLSHIPNANSASSQIVVSTYYKRADNTYFLVGDSARSTTTIVPDSIQPKLGALSWSETVTAVSNVLPSGYYLQSLSRPKLTLATSGTEASTGSTIDSITMVGTGLNGSGRGYEHTFPAAVAFNTTQTYTVTLTDTRGRTVSKTINLTPLTYARPTIRIAEFSTERTDTAGVPKWDGESTKTYWGVSVHTVKPTTTELNKLRVQLHAMEQDTTSYLGKYDTGSTLLNTLNQSSSQVTHGYIKDKSYSIRLTVTDAFGQTAQAIILLPTAEVALDIGKNNIGVGKIHERGTIDSIGQVYQNSGVEVPNGYVGILPTGNANSGAYWRGLKNGMYFKVETVSQENQLSIYAHVWVIGNGNAEANEKTIIWKAKVDGNIWHTGTNGSTATVNWKRIVDSSNIFTKDATEYDRVAGSTAWIRTPASGLLPYGTGTSSIGTAGWKFNEAHVNIIKAYDRIDTTGQMTQNGGVEVPNGHVGTLPAGDVNTGAYWRGLQNGMYWKDSTPAQTNQLSNYAHVWVIGTNNDSISEKTIIWKEKIDGKIWHAGTNSTTTTMKWKRLRDEVMGSYMAKHTGNVNYTTTAGGKFDVPFNNLAHHEDPSGSITKTSATRITCNRSGTVRIRFNAVWRTEAEVGFIVPSIKRSTVELSRAVVQTWAGAYGQGVADLTTKVTAGHYFEFGIETQKAGTVNIYQSTCVNIEYIEYD